MTYILSIVAWVQIHRSKGRVTGTAWAVVGTFVTPFAMCCGPKLLWAGAGRPIRILDGPGGTRLNLPGITVEDTPGGTRVRLPGITVEDTPGGTRVKLPGLEVNETSRGTRGNRVPQVRAANDAERAAKVFGGPAGMTDAEKAKVVRDLEEAWDRWHMDLPWDVPSWLYCVRLTGDRRKGRAVFTTGSDTVSTGILPVDGVWQHENGGAEEHQVRAADPGDRDGWLGE